MLLHSLVKSGGFQDWLGDQGYVLGGGQRSAITPGVGSPERAAYEHRLKMEAIDRAVKQGATPDELASQEGWNQAGKVLGPNGLAWDLLTLAPAAAAVKTGKPPADLSNPALPGLIPGSPSNKPVAAKPKKVEEHHSDPVFMGGAKNQPTTKMPQGTHRGQGSSLHNDLSKFLKDKTDAAGNNMRPGPGNSGADIRGNFTRQQRLDAMADFYKTFGNKYPDAARDFFNQHPHLK
ncbi:MAG: hypothetical protein ACK5Q5_20290 [Planctomycetaceae bacterium]